MRPPTMMTTLSPSLRRPVLNVELTSRYRDVWRKCVLCPAPNIIGPKVAKQTLARSRVDRTAPQIERVVLADHFCRLWNRDLVRSIWVHVCCRNCLGVSPIINVVKVHYKIGRPRPVACDLSLDHIFVQVSRRIRAPSASTAAADQH